MKNINFSASAIAIAFVTFILFACNSGADKNAQPATADSTLETIIVEQPDTVLFWTIDDFNKIKTQVYKDTIDITEPQSVINGINSIYPNIHLLFVKKSNDTVYAKIDSAFAFANDMGTSGAAEYLSTVVVNLTTLKDINYVNLDFQPGSHASPGVFNKEDYENFKTKQQ